MTDDSAEIQDLLEDGPVDSTPSRSIEEAIIAEENEEKAAQGIPVEEDYDEDVEEVEEEGEGEEDEEEGEETELESRFNTVLSKLDELASENERLRELINGANVGSEEDPANPDAASSPYDIKFDVPDEVFESIVNGDKEAFVKTLSSYGNALRQQMMMEERVRFNGMYEVRRIIDNFFSSPDNQDVLKVRGQVIEKAKKLERQHPDKPKDEVLAEASNAVRADLGLTRRKSSKRKSASIKKPGLAKGTSVGKTRPTSKKTKERTVSDEIEDIASLSHVRR